LTIGSEDKEFLMDDFRSTIGKHRMACFFLFPSSIVNQLPRPVPAPIVQLLAGKLASSLSIVNRQSSIVNS